MSLALETVIARLCVDFEFRRSFESDRVVALEPFGLSAADREVVEELDLIAIGEYAHGLAAKRIGLHSRWFPMTMFLLERGLPSHHKVMMRYVREHARTDGIAGNWVRNESVHLYKFLRERVADGTIDIRYFTDTLEFEAIKLGLMMDTDVQSEAVGFAEHAASNPLPSQGTALFDLRPKTGIHVRLQSFSYPMPDLMAALAKEIIPDLQEEETWVLFFKMAGVYEISTSTLNAPSRDLILMSDGSATLNEMCRSIGQSFGSDLGLEPEMIGDECIFLVRSLYEKGALTLV